MACLHDSGRFIILVIMGGAYEISTSTPFETFSGISNLARLALELSALMSTLQKDTISVARNPDRRHYCK